MKALKLNMKGIYFAIALLALLSSCRKNDITTAEATADDAADAITYALESSSGGAAEDISASAAYAMQNGYGKNEAASSLQCGVPLDTTVSYTYNGAVAANYSHNWNVLLNCNGPVPSSISWTGNYAGNFSGPRMESSNTGTRNFTLTGVEPSAQVYTLNGATTRTGMHTSKVRNQYAYNVTITTNLTNVTVNKSTYRITGGSGTANATLQVSNGVSKAFAGTIVFNGNTTATLAINGNTYTIQLY